MPRVLLDDCFLHDSDRLRHDDALALLKSRIERIVGSETVDLHAAAGRLLAEDVIAPFPVPAHTNAAVDGFAFAHASYDRQAGTTLSVEGRAAAGHPLATPANSAGAIRIFTGAVLPEGLDTVVMQEDVEQGADGTVAIPPGLKPGANVRMAGEDVAAGTTIFAAGTRLRPQDLAALASVGCGTVSCFLSLNVAIVSTGDEIIEPGARALRSGEVFDANAPMLTALANLTGANVANLGIWPDGRNEIETRLSEAAHSYDVILTSGGASRGEEDHMVAVLDKIGKRHMWQLAVKPGRPMMFGQINSRIDDDVHDTILIGLPGNPVAVFVCFLMYVYPMLQALGGAGWCEPQRLSLPADFEIPSRKTGRREFLRGFLQGDGTALSVGKFPRDGSGLISGLREADGLIDIPEDVEQVKRGDAIAFIPFTQFTIPRR